ncbi:MAG: hypothetical protein Roseis2KO_35220 [Roseivirga sp.]
MPENIFSPKMRQISLHELRVIVDSKDYVPEARQAAQSELEHRLKHNKASPPHGEPGYKSFLEELEKRGELTTGKNYQEFLEVEIDNQSVLEIAQKVFKKLQWTVFQVDEQAVLARRVGPTQRFTELVSFLINPNGEVIVYSQTMSAPPFSRNTNRHTQAVKLAIHVFHEILNRSK